MTHTDSEDADVLWACARKKAYPTEAVARLAISSIQRSSPGAEVRPYACRRCGLWHVGATPVSERVVAPRGADAPVAPDRRRIRRRTYGSKSVRRSRPESPRRRRDDDDD